MNRRDVLSLLATVTATRFAAADQTTPAGPAGQSPHPGQTGNAGEMLYRPLGATGEKVSVIGLGGHHIGRPPDAQLGIRLVRTAIDRGVTFLDNCWDYNDGESERRMGQALRDGYRARAFLMTKFDGRTKKAAAEQIDESLKRLQTDRIDLIQYHENIRMEDPDRFFAPDGALEAVMAAKQAGKVRFVGFTGHKDPAIHLRMLDVAAQQHFHFDTCQMPLNPMDAHFRSFEHQVLPRLVKAGIAPLGMKSMGDGILLQSKVVTPIECLHYALNLPTATVITGCESMERLEQALQAVQSFKPLAAKDVQSLLTRTRDAAFSGKYELFKTTNQFDGTAQHPQWLG